MWLRSLPERLQKENDSLNFRSAVSSDVGSNEEGSTIACFERITSVDKLPVLYKRQEGLL